MDPQLISIHYSDPLWIAFAFLCGLAIKIIGLPPMVGFLLAGFMLNALGAQGGEFLSSVSDLGITLLLFSIGLKLKFKSLARPEVWGVATIQITIVTLSFAALLLLLSLTHLPLLATLTVESALFIGFALSFSSTVFAVKILDELGSTNARYGKTTIGVLVVQDIAAVLFIAISIGKIPSPYATLLLLLIPCRYIFHWFLHKVGHGELLILLGITLALVGADIFELVGIKADVGALVFGMLLANHPKANELAKALLGFKELFLVGFFLSVGMTAIPSWTEIFIALIFILLLPLKNILFFGLFTLFRLKLVTSWRASFNLANYSEFGLIVGALAASSGWLPNEWLAVFAVVLSLSFVYSAPLVKFRDELYQKWHDKLAPLEHTKRLPEEENIQLTNIKLIIFGMGRMGTAAYNAMTDEYPDSIVGVELDRDKARKHIDDGKNIINEDVTNPDFWSRMPDLTSNIEWVLLTLPTHQAAIAAATQLKAMGYQGNIAATSIFHDQEVQLKALGVKHTFNIYTEAGIGFANELHRLTKKANED